MCPVVLREVGVLTFLGIGRSCRGNTWFVNRSDSSSIGHIGRWSILTRYVDLQLRSIFVMRDSDPVIRTYANPEQRKRWFSIYGGSS